MPGREERFKTGHKTTGSVCDLLHTSQQQVIICKSGRLKKIENMNRHMMDIQWEREENVVNVGRDMQTIHTGGVDNTFGECFSAEAFSSNLANCFGNGGGCIGSGGSAHMTHKLDEDIVDSIIAQCFENAEGNCVQEGGKERVSQNEVCLVSFAEGNSEERRSRYGTDRETEMFVESNGELQEAKQIGEGVDYRGRMCKKGKRNRAPARPWTEEEHQRFEESLELYGRNWEQCAIYIGTRRAQLVRSHAQKHLIKLWKLGKPLPKKVAESGNGYTLSGKPLLADSASAKSYLTKIPCPGETEQTE